MAAIASGLLTCEHDFCDDPPSTSAPCTLAGQCDLSCGFCDDSGGDGGHRLRRLDELHPTIRPSNDVGEPHLAVRSLQSKETSERRRAQLLNFDQCPYSSFEADAARVSDACCDIGREATCADGTPSECDARCAITFNDFFDRCQRLLSSAVSMSQMDDWGRLYNTCNTALPPSELLRALANCTNSAAATSTPPPPPPPACPAGAQQCNPSDAFTPHCSAPSRSAVAALRQPA